MFKLKRYTNITDVESCLYVGANSIHTKVVWKIHYRTSFRNSDYITPYLNPHEQCDCVEVLHPEKFRLRLRTLVQSADMPAVGLYISCEPTLPVKCHVEPEFNGKSMKDTVHTDHIGWQYITTFFWHQYQYDPEEYEFESWYDESIEWTINLNLHVYLDKELEVSALPAPEHTLSSNLSQLLTDQRYSDVKLLSQEGVEFKAHRAILAKRSPVLQKIFEHNENDNVITTPFKEDTLRQVLTYMYTDKTPETGDITSDLLWAADYYQLLGLKTICVAAFCKHLTTENSVAALELAIKFRCPEMIKFTVHYIKNNLELVTGTKDYKNINSVDVMKVLFENNLSLEDEKNEMKK